MTSCSNKFEDALSNDGLPVSFIKSMRTLFDIMDDQQTGFVKFTEIERRWQEDGTQGLPQGVLFALKHVTPSDGHLSFERFCSGLKMSLLRSCNISPANSLEAIPPLSVSSPQSSPRQRSRPMSAPILDQELFINQPPNVDVFETRKHSSQRLSNYDLMNYPHSHHHTNFDNRAYSAKSDIRMGIGSIKTSKSISNKYQSDPVTNLAFSNQNECNMQGPPKPPRSREEEYALQSAERLLESSNEKILDMRQTHSLERESRSDKRWHKDGRDEARSSTRVRGGSLERLLDSRTSNIGNTLNEEKQNTLQPMNRTGMRSALQTWFKEKSKSDLQNDANNNHRKVSGKCYSENPYKENRVPPPYSIAIDSCSRVSGDGVENYASNAKQRSYAGAPPPIPPHGIKSKLSSTYHPSAISHRDNGIYVKSLGNTLSLPAAYNNSEKVVGDDRTSSKNLYNLNNHGGRSGNNYISVQKKTRVESKSRHSSHSHKKPSGAKISSKADDGSKIKPLNGGITAHYVEPQAPQIAVHKKTAKKREPRRHTLQNGIEQNVTRRLRQLEAERDMLFQGMDVVEKARQWYKAQIHTISERIRYLPFGSNKEPSMELQQERLHFQLARLHEINSHLNSLMDEEFDSGLPARMNLAVGSNVSTLPKERKSDKMIESVVEQNKLLTEEVSSKDERITSLEGEKAALLRELFQTRARIHSSDSTFM